MEYSGANPPSIQSIKKTDINYYGNPKLTLNPENQEKYDYKNLLTNLQSYQSKYPNALHPLLTQTYISQWKTDLGKTARKYILDHLSHEKAKS